MSIKKYMRRYGGPRGYLPLVLAACGAGAAPAMDIGLRGRLIDSAAAGTDGFFPLLAAVLGLELFRTVCAALMGRMAQRHGIRQAARLDSARLEKAARVSFPVTETERFHSMWRSSADAPELDGAIFRGAGEAAELGVRLLLSLAVLRSLDARTAAGILVLLVLGVFLNRELARRTRGFWERYRENTRRSDYLSSLLMQREYAAERKIFAFDGEIDRRYREAFAGAKRENARLGRSRFTLEAVMRIVFALYSVAVVLMLMRPLLAGRMTLGLFASAFYAAEGLEGSCRRLYAAVYDIAGAAGRLGGFTDFMDLPEDPEPGGDRGKGKAEIRSVELRDVTFTYPGGDRPVLEHLSLRLEPGRHYALVGENGCGKSTLVKLLAGLYRPDSGEVLVNGVPAHELPPDRRRRLFSLVFQDFYRFPLTLRENASLCLDAPASDGELDKVFERLELRPAVLERREGYDSGLMPLFSGGAGLSGGEWQKLAVARCVLSGAPFAILDEPNASLDPLAEARIYGAYRELLEGRTTLFISHRLGPVRMCDEILVLRGGRLIAGAPHERLMRECGYYAELFNTQRGLYDEKYHEK